MIRGWIQTQAGQRYGTWTRLPLESLLFGLRHLPADLFYGPVWQATPRMWLSRQAQWYLLALCLGLARRFGKSTYRYLAHPKLRNRRIAGVLVINEIRFIRSEKGGSEGRAFAFPALGG